MNLQKLAVAIFSLGAIVCGFSATASSHQTDSSTHITEVRPAEAPGEETEVEQLLSISAEDLIHHMGIFEPGEETSVQDLERRRDDVARFLDSQTGVRAEGELCEVEESEFIAFPGADGRVHYRQLWNCPFNSATVTLENRVMHNTHGGYRHMGTIQVGEDIFQTVFDSQFPTYSVYLDTVEVEDEEAESTEENGSPWYFYLVGGILLVAVIVMGVARVRRG